MQDNALSTSLRGKEGKIRRLEIQQGFFILLFFISFGTASGNTAFDAVHVLKREKGVKSVRAICEIIGEQGSPQPDKWTILLNDPQSRSGVREVVVSQRKIISNRTPIAQYSGIGALPVLDMDSLKCNSTDAFKIVNSQAIQLGVGFHWVDYKLAQGTKCAIWKVHLSDYLGTSVGNTFISAETGAIIQPLKLDHARRSSRLPSEWVAQGGLLGHMNTTAKNIYHTSQKTVSKTMKSTANAAITVKEKTLSVMGDTQEWLTGKRTIGPR